MSRSPHAPSPSRRGFLRGLVSLPLIGGGVTLIGSPSAVAEPVTLALMYRYRDWLATEYGETLIEMEPLTHPQRLSHPHVMPDAQAWRREWCRENWTIADRATDPDRFRQPPAHAPSTRAALVLSAVGHDWREGGR
ncbi:hypothetical protein MKK50_18015 [Methylobacterium sp. J-043]|nr:hypothetical protein [Methylobacterium sp. J-043]